MSDVFSPKSLGVRAFHYGRGPQIHAGKAIMGADLPQPSHVRLWCGLSGSPSNRQFHVVETSDAVTCGSCLRAMGLRKA